MKKLLVVSVILLTGCSSTTTPSPVVTPSNSPGKVVGETAGKTVKKTLSSEGKPGAFCATSRLGKRFTNSGVTYECKGPKPYKWRRI